MLDLNLINTITKEKRDILLVYEKQPFIIKYLHHLKRKTKARIKEIIHPTKEKEIVNFTHTEIATKRVIQTIITLCASRISQEDFGKLFMVMK